MSFSIWCYFGRGGLVFCGFSPNLNLIFSLDFQKHPQMWCTGGGEPYITIQYNNTHNLRTFAASV